MALTLVYCLALKRFNALPPKHFKEEV